MSDELTQRQMLFLKYWLDPKEPETFDNAYQSAIKAGYSEEYANVLTTRGLEWMSGVIRRQRRIVKKAEQNLEALLDADDTKVKADLTKFALSRLKKREYSERNELTGANGESLVIKHVKYGENGATDGSGDTLPVQSEGLPDTTPQGSPEGQV